MLTDTAFDADLWQTATDQGWVSLHLPEQFGGLGLGLVELAVVAEETSRASLPGPFLPTVWAATLLSRLGNPALTSPYLNSIAEGKSKATVALLELETGWNPEDVNVHLEKANGAWTVKVADVAAGDIGLLQALELKLYGTVPTAELTINRTNQSTRLALQSAAPGWSYAIDVSTNLTSWTTSTTLKIPTLGRTNYTDTNALLQPRRFYRARLVP